MRDILILDCAEIGCPLVLRYVFIEMCEAFKTRGYKVKIINSIKDITNNSIVFMGDIFRHPDPCSLLMDVAPDAIYIGWYWINIQKTNLLKYFLHTHENMLNPNETVHKILSRAMIAHCPLLLRASESPELVGTYERNIVHDYCYMGWRYCVQYVPSASLFKGIYHGVCDHSFFLPYSERKKIYLSSIFALGFQADQNIINKHVSQRIFEGLAYGCIVLSNSLPACEQTNNIVVHIKSKEDLEQKMTFFKENPDALKKKQEEGYLFVKKFGTNHYSIDKFIQCIHDAYNLAV